MRWGTVVGGAAAGAGLYVGVVTGRVTVDLGVGRRTRELGPLEVHVDASPEIVFDVISEPYLKATPRAMADKLHVLERVGDMALAEHRTPVRRGFNAVTVETVRFSRPQRVDFRLVRGPVPHVIERFELAANDQQTRLRYSGELETDLWSIGAAWGQVVARRWLAAVVASLDSIKTEAERRAAHGRR